MLYNSTKATTKRREIKVKLHPLPCKIRGEGEEKKRKEKERKKSQFHLYYRCEGHGKDEKMSGFLLICFDYSSSKPQPVFQLATSILAGLKSGMC
jgi:hypothetical protein